MISFDYAPRGSLVESIDPRAQIIFYLGFTTGALITTDPRVLAALWLIALVIALFARLRWRETARAWLALVGLIALFTVINLLVGRTVDYAVANALKLLALFTATIISFRTINPAEYGVMWRGLGAPDKIAFTMNLMMRFVPTLTHDFGQTMDAQRARGLELDKPKGGFTERVRRFAPLLVPVIVRSVVDSTDVADAMELRAFGAAGRRTWLRALRYRPRDFVVITLGVCVLAACLALAAWPLP